MHFQDWWIVWQGTNWLALRKESSYAIAQKDVGVIIPALSQSDAVTSARENDLYQPIRGC